MIARKLIANPALACVDPPRNIGRIFAISTTMIAPYIICHKPFFDTFID